MEQILTQDKNNQEKAGSIDPALEKLMTAVILMVFDKLWIAKVF
jgi:hypothetical protein